MRATGGRSGRLIGVVLGTLCVLNGVGRALIIGGGGRVSTDCLTVFSVADTVTLTRPTHITCTDGDPNCDADGVVNGTCQIQIGVCANSTQLNGCTLDGVESITVLHAQDNGDPKFDPELQALQTRINGGINPPDNTADHCTSPTSFHVAVKGPYKNAAGANVCSPNFKTLKLATTSSVINGKIFTDNDTLKISCVPAACDPTQFYTDTFDRVQHQIFDQNCAVSHCHDSMAHRNGLILEAGASYTNLINVDPHNTSALAAQWKRVKVDSPDSGDPANSFLYHKVTGSFPNRTFGARMPKGKAKLNRTLLKIINLWIAAGAPDSSNHVWVPGTD